MQTSSLDCPIVETSEEKGCLGGVDLSRQEFLKEKSREQRGRTPHETRAEEERDLFGGGIEKELSALLGGGAVVGVMRRGQENKKSFHS